MRAYGLGCLIAFATDQLSKIFVVFYGLRLIETQRLDVVPPLLRFHLGWNEGINFGLFGGGLASRWVLIGVACAISLAVSIWAFRSFQSRPKLMLMTGLLVGGALANALDRVVHGAVVDFLNMSCCGINNPFVFNVADIWVFVGAIGLMLWADEKKPT